jgi:long-chain acyl-CoA synthetase
LCDPLCWTSEACGDIPSGIEIKLVDFPDAGYYATNQPHPQGEIWIRGTPVFEGYFQNEEETKEAIAEGGWFMTGDIGEWHRDGQLKIIDRKKNLVKTLNGEYIALEKVFPLSPSPSRFEKNGREVEALT